MKILFDHNVPVYLTKLLPGHEVTTAYRRGWSALHSGKLLEAAEEAGFELLVTMDKNVRYRQSMTFHCGS